MLSKEAFAQYSQFVDVELLQANYKDLYLVYRVLERYHETHDSDPTHDDLALSIQLEYPHLKQEAYEALTSIVSRLRTITLSDEATRDLVSHLRRSQYASNVAAAALRVSAGSAKWEELADIIAAYGEVDEVSSVEDEFVTQDLHALLDSTVKTPGLRWRLNTMNQMLGSLRKGDFGFLMARPETGKTTFLASEVSYMAGQTNAPILWLNNEEQGEKVMLRLYEAALGATLPQLLKYPEKAQQKFMEATQGNIRLVDDAGLSKRQVEALCKTHKPALIVFDQLDKIKGFDDDRMDLQLGKTYRWARELAKTYAPVIAVCQASAEADGVMWLNMGHAANAKTEKQAEADWILGIGKTYRDGLERERYLHLSKNKLIGDQDTVPALRHGKKAVYIEAEIGRYLDVQ